MENTTIDEAHAAAIYGGATPEPDTPEVVEAPETTKDAGMPDTAGTTEEPEAPEVSAGAAIAEAEERGYRRGLEEAGRRELDRPAMWQPVPPDAAATFLAGRRPSVWD